MEEQTTDLSRLFDAALESIEENRQAVNDLDGYNGNHGDNMAQNMRIVRDTVAEHEGEPPSEALRWASHELARRGRGGTNQYYVRGLNDAADQLEGHPEMRQGEVMALVQSLLGAVPQEGHPQQMEAGSSVYDQVLNTTGQQVLGGQAGSGAQSSPLDAFLGAQQGSGGAQPGSGGAQPGSGGGQQPPAAAGDLGDLLGALQGAQPSSGGGQPDLGGGGLGDLLGALQGGQPGSGGGQGSPLDALLGAQGAEGGGQAGDLIQALLPAAMAFLQAKQSGAENTDAAGQALMSVLGGGQTDPLQAGAPRPAAGGLIAQSLLGAFLNR